MTAQTEEFAPTAEQQAIIDAAKTGGTMVIEAGAGTGKTATLRLIARALAPKRGLYVAYNKAIQTEAASSFPSNVECRTSHSLAWHAIIKGNRGFAARLKARNLSARQYATELGIQPFNRNGDSLTPRQLAVIVKQSISRFCNSDATEPTRWHIPYQGDGIDQDALVAHLLPYVKKAWQNISTTHGKLNFNPDCYLKLWSLSHPTLRYGFILYDEAQDSNPCVSSVIERQQSQCIMVGDRAQAIYGWRGAVDAMQGFKAEHHLYLSQSFRFGSAIAEMANRWLNIIGTPLRLTGFDKIASTVAPLTQPDAILCRSNAGCIESAMHYQKAGYQVAIAGSTNDIELFCKAADELMNNNATDHPELAVYRDWPEVLAAVESGEADDIGMMVRLISNYGVTDILAVCKASAKPEDADITVSTAHKSKGLEWDTVQIHTDFYPPKNGIVNTAEAMLCYVACTRAKVTLDATALAWMSDYETVTDDTSEAA